MHLSDTLVLGPLPLVGRSIRLQLGVVLAGMFAAVVAAIAALVVADAPVVSPLRSLVLGTVGGQWAVAPAARRLCPAPIDHAPQESSHLGAEGPCLL